MKNFILLTLIGWLGLSLSTSAQAPMRNLEGNARSITGKLTDSLKLTEDQQSKVLDIVTGFLQQKRALQPLATDNKKAYDIKLNSMQKGLATRLKRALMEEQFMRFQALKPPTDDPTNVLSQLFY
jgi:hypothetical protein